MSQSVAKAPKVDQRLNVRPGVRPGVRDGQVCGFEAEDNKGRSSELPIYISTAGLEVRWMRRIIPSTFDS